MSFIAIIEDADRDGKADVVAKIGDSRIVKTNVLAIAHAAVVHDPMGGSEIVGRDGKKQLFDAAPARGFSILEAYKPTAGKDMLRLRSAPIRFSVQGPNFT